MKHFCAGLLTFALLLGGCGSLGDDTVLLRVQNATSVDFTEVYIQFMGDPTTYGAVEAGDFSNYRAFDIAYRYGLVEATASADTTYRLQPIDYVGETPLDPGRYTFRLSLSHDQLGLELVRD